MEPVETSSRNRHGQGRSLICDGKSYYFCSAGFKEKFEKAPEKFAQR